MKEDTISKRQNKLAFFSCFFPVMWTFFPLFNRLAIKKNSILFYNLDFSQWLLHWNMICYLGLELGSCNVSILWSLISHLRRKEIQESNLLQQFWKPNINVLLILASVCICCLHNSKPWEMSAQCFAMFEKLPNGSVIDWILFRL